MINGDCDNNFVFINALQYTLYMHIIFFLFLGYKPKNQKKKHKKPKKNKKTTSDFEKNLFFCNPVLNKKIYQGKLTSGNCEEVKRRIGGFNKRIECIFWFSTRTDSKEDLTGTNPKNIKTIQVDWSSRDFQMVFQRFASELIEESRIHA